MRYIALAYADDRADLSGRDELRTAAGDAIVATEVLRPSTEAHTIRHDDGRTTVIEGPYADTAEALTAFYVLEAASLDDAIALARQIPEASIGGVEVRPMVEWQDRQAEVEVPGSAVRYLATIHGPDDEGEIPGTAEWDAGAAEHGRWAAEAGDALLAGGALHPTSTATSVQVRDGELLLSDGPYIEAVEVVGGFYLLWSTDADDAVALAGRIPTGPEALSGIELRPIEKARPGGEPAEPTGRARLQVPAQPQGSGARTATSPPEP
jgi:hypothetical protein